MADTGAVLNKASDLVTQVFTQLDAAAQHYGPQALNLVEQVIRWDAAGYLVLGLFGVVLMVIAARFIMWAIKQEWFIDAWDDISVGGGLSIMGSALLSVVGLILSTTNLLDIWNWVSFFNPGIGLAHKVVVKVLGG